MLYDAGYHKSVPREVAANLQFRAALWDECNRSRRARDLTLRACTDDILFWINAFCWQTNPEMVDAEDGPFVTFPVQEEYVLFALEHNVVGRRPILLEKSRKQGGTFLNLFIDLWLTRFHKRKRALVMSHNEKAVERSGDEDTLFGKIDFIISRLPSWMQDGLPRVKGVYQFKSTKSQIAGVATTTRSGVGGRATTLTLDEFSKYQNAEAILSQTRDTGPPKIIGTHYGVGGQFYELSRRPDTLKFVLHWSKCPLYNRGLYRSDPNLSPLERVVDKDNPPPPDYPFVVDGTPLGGPFPGLRSPYYDAVCKDRSAREVAIHWDINPEGASHQFFDQHMIADYVRRYAKDPVWVGDILHDPVGRFQGLKEDASGPLKLWVRFPAGHRETNKWVPPGLYKVGADIGAGTGATPTCFCGGDALTGRKVLEYANATVKPEPIAAVARAVCELLASPDGAPAQILWDGTGPTGKTFMEGLKNLGMRNFWYWRDEFKLAPRVSENPGWFFSPAGKLLLLNEYEDALRKGLLTNPSKNALLECLAFEKIDGKIEHGHSVRSENPDAGTVNHSDVAFADFLMWKLMKEAGAARVGDEARPTAGFAPGSFGDMLRGLPAKAASQFRR